ncbi:hypothetical protein CC79DRAFT_1374500 [Sarocladium strictum]
MRYTTVANLTALLSTVSALPSNLQARDGGKSTKVTLGRNYIDYGCEADIKKLLKEAIEDKCVGEAQCDDASPYVAKIQWSFDESGDNDVEASSNWFQERNIYVTVEGEYPNKDALKGVKDLVVDSVQDGTWDWHEFQVTKPSDPSWTGLDGGGESEDCGMVRFPNYIGVAMFDGDTSDYSISITVEVDDSKPDDSFCSDDTQDDFELVLTPVPGGSYLSTVSGLFCAAFDS